MLNVDGFGRGGPRGKDRCRGLFLYLGHGNTGDANEMQYFDARGEYYSVGGADFDTSVTEVRFLPRRLHICYMTCD